MSPGEDLLRRLGELEVMHQGRVLKYLDYLAHPHHERLGDEADVVDRLFVERCLLPWLGYPSAEVTYNRTQQPQKGRPDFVVRAGGGAPSFVIECKATTEEFDDNPKGIDQLRRYTAGTNGYAVWTNGRQLIGLRFPSRGDYEILVSADLDVLWDRQQRVFEGALEDQLALFHAIFGRKRFTEFTHLVEDICVPEEEWDPISLDSEEALRHFIEDSNVVLESLKVAAQGIIRFSRHTANRLQRKHEELMRAMEEANARLLSQLPPEYQNDLRVRLSELVPRLGSLNPVYVRRLKPSSLPLTLQVIFDNWIDRVTKLDAAARSMRLQGAKAVEVTEAFHVWAARQADPERASEAAFAEQVAYVFFVRLMLARILEDKGMLEHRVASDGGFAAWRDLVSRHFATTGSDIQGASFLSMLFSKVSAYYQHFFQQPVFDWFIPDDYLLVRVLAHLNRYHFGQISADVLGFTYENYIDRVERNRKGHFLTPFSVVDFILDRVGYEGEKVIGAKVLDPAVGSGSFLIRAVRRLREALKRSVRRRWGLPDDMPETEWPLEARKQLAREFVTRVQEDFYGMDVNPFACYLAELNLLIQLLDDLHVLWDEGVNIESFGIYSTDSLDLPAEVRYSSDGESIQGLGIFENGADAIPDESYVLKRKSGPFAAGFHYVISNPPYVTSKRQELVGDFRTMPFFREYLSGDANLYLLFLRLGAYFTARGGRLGFIVPLTLMGDASAEAIRRLFTTGEWHLVSLTRFYGALVLFQGVDQHVCVVVAERNAPRETHQVEVRGGMTTVEAERTKAIKSIDDITGPAPAFTTEHRNWPLMWRCIVPEVADQIWRHVAAVGESPLGDLFDCVHGAQGDVNTTHVRPFRSDQWRPGAMPAYKGQALQPFAPLGSPPAWVVPEDRPGLNRDQRRALTRLLQIKNLDRPQCGFVLQEVVNIPVHQRLRGTWFERDRNRPLVFQHTVWRFVAHPGREKEAMALFGLLQSHLLSYLYGMWSTNTHVQQDHLKRLPIPNARTFPVNDLAEATERTLEERRQLAALEEQYGAKLPTGSRHDVAIQPQTTLRSARIPTIRVRDAVARGLVSISGRARRLGALLEGGHLHIAGPQSFQEAVRILLAALGNETRWDDIQNQELPEPHQAQAWLDHYRACEDEVRQTYHAFREAWRDIDAIVFDWYGLTDAALQQAVLEGLPWEYQNRGVGTEEGNGVDLGSSP